MKANLQKVESIASTVAEELGYELYRVQMLREQGRSILRITIDHDDGISHDDCERYSRVIDKLLDEADPIPYNYYLEISSPGLYRHLYTESHYEKYLGAFVKITCKQAVAGSRTLKGDLVSFDQESIKIKTSEGEIQVPRQLIKSVQLDVS